MKYHYIAFEGIDGSGKTTQIGMLSNVLSKLNYTPIHLFEPTYSEYGREIRRIMFESEDVGIERQTELFNLDRKHHIKYKIAPLLSVINRSRNECGLVLLQDRSYYSSPAYQANAEEEMIASIALQESYAPRPDIVFLIDTPPEMALRRIAIRRDETNMFEQIETLSRVRSNYQFVAQREDVFVVVDGSKTQEEISQIVLDSLQPIHFSPPL